MEEIKQEIKYINLEIDLEGRKFMFYIPEGTQIGTAYNAAYQVLLKIVDIGKQAAENMHPKEEPEKLN